MLPPSGTLTMVDGNRVPEILPRRFHMDCYHLSCPFIDPVLCRFGPFVVSWYGVMCALAVVVWACVTGYELYHNRGPVPLEALPELFFHGVVGAIIGARLGYVFIFNLPCFLDKPWEIFAFWKGGMSVHGAFVGLTVSALIVARRSQVPLDELSDLGVLGIPLGLMFIKIGNFINCESFGRVTTVPWGVVFPAGGDMPRHPVQLYEAFLEGPLLFAILCLVRSRARAPGKLVPVFLIGYGAFRFLTEFVREPDSHSGLVMHGFTTAQMLCAIMVALGVGLLIRGRKDSQKRSLS